MVRDALLRNAPHYEADETAELIARMSEVKSGATVSAGRLSQITLALHPGYYRFTVIALT
jgi:hypothetical protein